MNFPVIPLLKAADWIGNKPDQGRLLSKLPIDNAITDAAVPVVAYALEESEHVAFVAADANNVAQQSSLKDSAIALLRRRLSAVDWEPLGLENAGAPSVMAFTNHYNAAECLLLPERLAEAQALLNADALLACTPQRGLLLVCAYAADNSAQTKSFINLCYELYAQAQNEPISPIVWGVRDGLIQDRLRLRDDTIGHVMQRSSLMTPVVEAESPLVSAGSLLGDVSETVRVVRLYTPSQIAFMTLFGTVLAGFYGISKNYKALQLPNLARLSVVIACVVVPAFIVCFFVLPSTGYDSLFPIGAALLMGFGSRLTQGRLLQIALSEGALSYRVGNQCLVVAVALLVMLPLVALIASVVPG